MPCRALKFSMAKCVTQHHALKSVMSHSIPYLPRFPESRVRDVCVFFQKAFQKLSIFGCATMLHDNSWNCLLKDMIDVMPTLGSIHPFVPKFWNAGNEFFFRSGLGFWLEVQLQLMPNVLNRMEVWAFRKGHKMMVWQSHWWMEWECPQECYNFKLHQTLEVKNVFKSENVMFQLTFNPGLMLTSFRTTRPWSWQVVRGTGKFELVYNSHHALITDC